MEVIKISTRVAPGTYINDAKSKLGSSGKVELSALENGISVAIRVADSLVNLGYATVSRFETSLLENDGDSGRFKGLAKVTIKLDKAATFEKASKDYERRELNGKVMSGPKEAELIKVLTTTLASFIAGFTWIGPVNARLGKLDGNSTFCLMKKDLVAFSAIFI